MNMYTKGTEMVCKIMLKLSEWEVILTPKGAKNYYQVKSQLLYWQGQVHRLEVKKLWTC